MQHFLSENNPINSPNCQVLIFVDEAELNSDLLKTHPEFKSLYEAARSQVTKAGDWFMSMGAKQESYLIYYLGAAEHIKLNFFKKHMEKLAEQFKHKAWSSMHLNFPKLACMSPEDIFLLSVEAYENAYYQFNRYKEQSKPLALEAIYYNLQVAPSVLEFARARSQGIRLCKDLANMPANDCTPVFLEQTAKDLSHELKPLQFKSLDVADMQKLGMNALLAVGQGSDHAPRLIELHYQAGQKHQKPLLIIGKGICFDSGGISLKPAEGMNEMKYDMSGAAAVMGLMRAIALLKLPLNVIGIMACAENMPSGTATRPGDVVKSMSGKTIEITNTDAEGRLVLADAISYAHKYQPELIIDLATLTGAVLVALGHEYTGLMSSSDALAEALLAAGQRTQDKIWRLPLDDAYQEYLESPVADMVNAHASRLAGTIVAATFLKTFTGDIAWAHLDIAGTAWVSGKHNHATGRPIALLLEWLKTFAQTKVA